VRGAGDCLDVDLDELDDMAGPDEAGGDRAAREQRDERYTPGEAQYKVQQRAAHEDDDARPYADPYYWAAFQITGW
jgi:CHAT domain-containing protein